MLSIAFLYFCIETSKDQSRVDLLKTSCNGTHFVLPSGLLIDDRLFVSGMVSCSRCISDSVQLFTALIALHSVCKRFICVYIMYKLTK